MCFGMWLSMPIGSSGNNFVESIWKKCFGSGGAYLRLYSSAFHINSIFIERVSFQSLRRISFEPFQKGAKSCNKVNFGLEGKSSKTIRAFLKRVELRYNILSKVSFINEKSFETNIYQSENLLMLSRAYSSKFWEENLRRLIIKQNLF